MMKNAAFVLTLAQSPIPCAERRALARQQNAMNVSVGESKRCFQGYLKHDVQTRVDEKGTKNKFVLCPVFILHASHKL